MPMAPYPDIDFGSRISVLRTVGTALSVSTSQMPDQSAANSDRDCLKWINFYNAEVSLPLYGSLDFSGFTSAINALVALVP